MASNQFSGMNTTEPFGIIRERKHVENLQKICLVFWLEPG